LVDFLLLLEELQEAVLQIAGVSHHKLFMMH